MEGYQQVQQSPAQQQHLAEELDRCGDAAWPAKLAALLTWADPVYWLLAAPLAQTSRHPAHSAWLLQRRQTST